jgi:hypothetical protein
MTTRSRHPHYGAVARNREHEVAEITRAARDSILRPDFSR